MKEILIDALEGCINIIENDEIVYVPVSIDSDDNPENGTLVFMLGKNVKATGYFTEKDNKINEVITHWLKPVKLSTLQPSSHVDWIDVKDAPRVSKEYNVVISDDDVGLLVTSMYYDTINKRWIDTRCLAMYTNVLQYAELPSPPNKIK